MASATRSGSGSKGTGAQNKYKSPNDNQSPILKIQGDNEGSKQSKDKNIVGPASGSEFESENEMKVEIREFREEMKKLITGLSEKMTKRLSDFESKISKKIELVQSNVTAVKKEVEDIKSSVRGVDQRLGEVEKAVGFLEGNLEDNQKKQDREIQELKSKFSQELEELQNKFMFLEKHDRKYNLLFYGYEESQDENVFELLRHSFISDLGIDEERARNMYFANGHRIPSENTGPNPIILKFTSFKDRELVLSLAFKLMKSRKRILVDLPVTMKKERARLASVAYQIRQKEHLQTRIRDKGLEVFLEVRKNSSEKWVKRVA